MTTLAAVQSNCTVGEVAANLDQTLRLLREAPMWCAQMVVLSECCSPRLPNSRAAVAKSYLEDHHRYTVPLIRRK
jgi:predicted amidohydrolase